MATFSYDTGDFAKLMLDLDSLADGMDEYIPEMLNAGADVLVDGQKKTAREYGVVDTGEMISSIGKSNVKISGEQTWRENEILNGRHINIYPQGDRTRGDVTTSNAEIAFVNEFGKRGQPARPFILAANERYADKAVDAMYKVYIKYLASKNL